MRIRVFSAHAAERCVYCHDTLEPDRVECACGAAYHLECGDVCVTLGCKGALERRTRVVRTGSARVAAAFVVMATAAVVIPLGVALAAVDRSPARTTLAVLALMILLGFGCMVAADAAFRSRRPIKPRKRAPGAAMPAVAPPQERGPTSDLELPGFDVQRRELDAAPTEAELLARRSHLDGKRGASRPPGLGKTL